MKIFLAMLAALSFAAWLPAQAPDAAPAYTPDQLDQLLAPIALYPDPLVAVILPASAAATDVVLAERYLAGGSDPAQIDAQPWDPSVRALARYPDVIGWLDSNLNYTRALGDAFVRQPSDAMQAVQRLRARALAAGSLTSTAQQTVTNEGGQICIWPAQADAIYLPQYDPELVYDVPPGYAGPFITFGLGFPVGPWLSYECNWDGFGIWIGEWHRGWGYHRDWERPGVGRQGAWRPDPRRLQQGRADFRPASIDRFRPAPMRGAPRPPAGYRPAGPGARPDSGPARPAEGRSPAAAARPAERPELRQQPSEGRAVSQAAAPAHGASPPARQAPQNGRGAESRPPAGHAPAPAAHAAPAPAPRPSPPAEDRKPQS